MPTELTTWPPTGPLQVQFTFTDGPPRLVELNVDGTSLVGAATLPLAEVGVFGEGRSWSARRYVQSTVGARLRYLRHETREVNGAYIVEVTSRDDDTGLEVTTVLINAAGTATLRTYTRVVNAGDAAVGLAWVASAVLAPVLPGSAPDAVQVWWADNDWLAECRWQSATARSVLPDLTREAHQHDPRGGFSRTALGAWSSDGSLPMGVVINTATGTALAWQIEHNGPWHWQLGEHAGGLYLSLLGPTDTEHAWNAQLVPGESFTTVPVTLAVSLHGFEGAIGELTAARRFHRRPHPDHTELPVIFNDYMNTLMGDPTTEKLLPLIDAAARAGAETFVIDAGWYDDQQGGWWDTVGAWEPAADRFPGGFEEVLDHIRAQGMTPGLWVEPEVVGVRSPLAQTLPPEAFFQRHGTRIVEHGRYQLDLRHPLARKHLDTVIDRLVNELGVGYFKLDYNINPGAGTDVDAPSVGAGLLGHNRAYLDWLDGVLDRHPRLTLENCASGGMRIDYALLSRQQLQSTSDQQDPYRYPAISASAATAIAPEQAATWSYPQPEFDDDQIVFTMSGALLSRMHLSGHLDLMTESQHNLVAEAVAAYRAQRTFVVTAYPFWPLGLPDWDAGWIAHGLRDDNQALITLWRRDADDEQAVLQLPEPFGPDSTVAVAYPRSFDGSWEFESPQTLTVRLPRVRQAVTIKLSR